MRSLQTNGNEKSLSIQVNLTGDVEDITHHTQDIKLAETRRVLVEEEACPGDEIIGKLGQVGL